MTDGSFKLAATAYDEGYNKGAEEMRRQIEIDVWDVFQSKRFVAEGPRSVLMAIRNCALSVEPDHD